MDKRLELAHSTKIHYIFSLGFFHRKALTGSENDNGDLGDVAMMF